MHTPGICKTKQFHLSPKLYKEYPHIEYSIAQDAAFCFVCSPFSGSLGKVCGDEAWVQVGVR